MAKQASEVRHKELLSSLKILISETCKTGAIESQMDSEGVTIKLRFGKEPNGDLTLSRKIAALLAQETM